MNNKKYEKMLEAVKPFLRRYLNEKGIQTSGNKLRCVYRFSKIPKRRHTDTTMSATITNDNHHIYCNGCGRTLDILDVALLLEPQKSKGWKSSWVMTLEFLYRKYCKNGEKLC